MPMNLQRNYVRVIRRYSDFNGRAGRQEFWKFVLANIIIQIALNSVLLGVFFLTSLNLMFIASLYLIATLVPSVAVAVRRLHDINRSGWWELLQVLPIAGPLGLIVMYSLEGTNGDNNFGPRPKEISKDEDDLETSVEQTESDLENKLKQLKDIWVSNLTSEKQTEMELKKKTQEYETWEKRAAMAVANNNDDVARQCLAKKHELNQTIQALTIQLQSQQEASASLKAKYSEMLDHLKNFRMKKSTMNARYQASQAACDSQEELNKARSGSAMDKMEEKLRAKEALNEANSELAQSRRGPQQEGSLEVEDELAAMKKSLSGQQ